MYKRQVLPFFTAFKLHYLIHVVIGWLGLFVLIRSYGLTRSAAFLGSSLFFFSGIYLSSFEFYNHIAALAWMPWVLVTLHKNGGAIRRKIILSSFLWSLHILAGTPEVVLITFFFTFAQSAFNGKEWKKCVAVACLSLLVACFITAAQLLPSLETLLQTNRQEQARIWPLELIQLANIPFPNFLGNDRQPGHDDLWGRHLFDRGYPLYYSLYMGFGGLILACFALRKSPFRKTKILFWTGFLFFLISCGRYSPFFFLYRFAPVIESIRYPVKFLLGSVFCLSILAAFGYQSIERREEKKGTRFPFLILVAAGFSSIYWALRVKVLSSLNTLFLIEREASLRDLGRSIETGLLLLIVFSILLYFKDKNIVLQKSLPRVILLLAILDPAFHNRHINPTIPISFFDQPPLVDFLSPSKTIYREESFPDSLANERMGSSDRLLFLYQSLYPFCGIGHGVRYVLNKDFMASYSREYYRRMSLIQGLPRETKFKILEYLGCSLAISERRIFPNFPGHKWKIHGLNVWLEPVADHKAGPRIIYQTVSVDSFDSGIKAFSDPAFDPEQMAVTRNGLHLKSKALLGATPIVRIKKEIQGRGWYTLETQAEAVVVIPGNYAPGWKAWIDGEPADIFEANLFSKGVLVPPGRHDIEVRYLPATFVIGAIISLATVGLSLILFGLQVRGFSRVHHLM